MFAARAAAHLLTDSAATHSRAFFVDWTRVCSRVAVVQRITASGGMRMLARVQVCARRLIAALTPTLTLTLGYGLGLGLGLGLGY